MGRAGPAVILCASLLAGIAVAADGGADGGASEADVTLVDGAEPAPTGPVDVEVPGTLDARGADTMLASALGAIEVVGPDGETLGDVEDTVLGHDGRVVALLIGVGGFLGLGEKTVAVRYERLSVRPTEEGFVFVSELDRAALEAAPAFAARGR